jgi:hypothetical protein
MYLGPSALSDLSKREKHLRIPKSFSERCIALFVMSTLPVIELFKQAGDDLFLASADAKVEPSIDIEMADDTLETIEREQKNCLVELLEANMNAVSPSETHSHTNRDAYSGIGEEIGV